MNLSGVLFQEIIKGTFYEAQEKQQIILLQIEGKEEGLGPIRDEL